MLGLSKFLGRLFPKRRARPADVNPWVNSLKWIPANESPFGVDVLDCRVLAEEAKVTIRDGDIAGHFYSSRKDVGLDYIGKTPENAVDMECSLDFTWRFDLKEGPVFKADRPEIKWDIYFYENGLYFVRTWTGELVFRAAVAVRNEGFSVTGIKAASEMLGNSPGIAIEQVKYLVRSHIFNELYPHPVPVGFSRDPREIALYSVTCYGAKGLFATFDKPGK